MNVAPYQIVTSRCTLLLRLWYSRQCNFAGSGTHFRNTPCFARPEMLQRSRPLRSQAVSWNSFLPLVSSLELGSHGQIRNGWLVKGSTNATQKQKQYLQEQHVG